MSLSDATHAELNELVDSFCEGRLAAGDVARLEVVLRDDEARQWYLSQVHLFGLLKWELSQSVELDSLRQLKQLRKDAEIAPVHKPRVAPSTGWWWAVAASIVPLITASWVVSTFSSSKTEAPSARSTVVLAQAVNVLWADGAADAPRLAEALPPGKLRLAAGLVRLDYACGAVVTLEGPAEFTLVDERSGVLHRGRLTAKVPPSAIGFRIDTPSLAVVDLGTAFGVVADDTGISEVQVFDGEVIVALRNAESQSPQRRLSEGSAARVNAGRTQIEDARFDGSEYRRSWPMTWGVLEATGAVKFIEPRPVLVPRTYEDDEHLIVFPEHESLLLTHDLSVAVRESGTYVGPFDPRAAQVSAGTNVRSYLMQFNPIGRREEPVRAIRGSVTFDRPIVGLICTTKELNAGDKLFGKGDDWRPGRGGGGIEGGDRVVLSSDRRTLAVDLTAAAANDQIRVLVEAAPSITLAAGN